MDKLYSCCIILLVFGTASTAEEKSPDRNSTRNKILIGIKDLKDEYKIRLVKLTNNNFKNYGMNVMILNKGCDICDKIPGLLMNESSQSFLMINDIAESNYSVRDNVEFVPHIGYYKFIVFLTEKVDQIYENFAKLRSREAWNPRARHLIFTVEKPNDKELERVFRDFWSHKVLNVAVLIHNSEEAHTYNPYLKNGSEMRERIYHWSKLFYDKVKNMNGHVISAKYIPFTAGTRVKWIKEESRYKFFGLDYGYAMAFFENVNATPGFVDLTNDKIPLYREWTYRYRIWNTINFQDIELWFQAIPNSVTVQERTEDSYPIIRNDLRILVPRSGIKNPSLLEPFNNVTWICVLISLVTFAAYSHVLYEFRGIVDNAILRTFGVFLGKNLAKRKYGVMEKMTFMILTMSSLLLLSAYQGELYGVLATVSHYPEINTMLELTQKIKSIYTYHLVAKYLRAYVPESIKVVDFGSDDYLEFMKTHRDVAYAYPNNIAEDTSKSTVLSENGVPFYRSMNDFAVSDYSSLLLPYGSPYLDKLNRIVLFCKESGLDQYWKMEANHNAILSGTIISNDAEERTPKKLSLYAQQTAFCILGVGLLFSSFCFVVEIYCHRTKKTNFRMRLIARAKNVAKKRNN